MKNVVIGILTALMIGGWAVAAEEKNDAEISGIRVTHGMVSVLSDNGTWEEIGSVSALKAALQEHDSPVIETSVAVPKTAAEEETAQETETKTQEETEAAETNDGAKEENRNEIVAQVKEEVLSETPEASEEAREEETNGEEKEDAEKAGTIEARPAEESVTDIISIATDETGEILINGKATGYRLARIEKEGESEAKDAENKEEAETKEEEITEPEEKTEPEAVRETETEEAIEAKESVLHEVKIIYVDEDGEELGNETLTLAEGIHASPELRLPAETELVSDPKIEVKEGKQSKIMIVHRNTVYPVEVTYIDSTGKVLSQKTLELAPGSYATGISQLKGKDLTVLPESGYVAVYPKTIQVEKTKNSFDIVVKPGNTCGENAEYDENRKACVCKLDPDTDPYAKACPVSAGN